MCQDCIEPKKCKCDCKHPQPAGLGREYPSGYYLSPLATKEGWKCDRCGHTQAKIPADAEKNFRAYYNR